MIVPKWFSKALRVIDPTYTVGEPDDHNGYFIIKDIDLTLKTDGGKTLSIPGGSIENVRARGSLPVLWIPELAEHALEKLREMKRQALEMGIYENPADELAYYQKLKREAKKRKESLAVDMISEGLMEAYKLERKKSWSNKGS